MNHNSYLVLVATSDDIETCHLYKFHDLPENLNRDSCTRAGT